MDTFFAEYPFLTAGDGFRVCTLPLSRLLELRGIDTLPGDREELPCRLYFDDWHLYRIPEGTWGLVKLREREHDGGDSDVPGMTVSFIAFDLRVLKRCLEEPVQEHRRLLEREIHRVVAAPGQRHAEALRRYFLRARADAPYLLGRLYIQKLLAMAPKEGFPLPARLSPRLRRFLEADGALEGSRLLPDRASPEAVLACHSGNVSLHSLAAEIRFHAVFLKPRLPGVYGSAIRADMGVLRREFLPVMPYYNPRSLWLRAQEKAHPDRDLWLCCP